MFRNNVVAALVNEDGQILGCNRRDRKGYQCVQGGVDEGEDFLAAAWREIDEEIGLTPDHGVSFIGFVPPPQGDATKLRYLLPKYAAPSLRAQGYVGQQQTLLLFYCPRVAIQHVRLVPTIEQARSGAKQEFRGVQWMPLDEFLLKVGDLRLHIFQHLAKTIPDMIDQFFAADGPKRNANPPETAERTSRLSVDSMSLPSATEKRQRGDDD